MGLKTLSGVAFGRSAVGLGHHDWLTWLQDESPEHVSDPPEPEELAIDAISGLTAVIGESNEIVAMLENSNSQRSPG